MKAVAPVSDEEPFWQVRVELIPPSDEQSDKVVIEYQVIGQELVTHESVIVLAQDDVLPEDGKLPRVLANLRAQRKKVTIERPEAAR